MQLFITFILMSSVVCKAEKQEFYPTKTTVNGTVVPTVVDENGVVRRRILGPDDPCFKYQKNNNVNIVASCEEVIDGRVSSPYKKYINRAKICVLNQKSFGKNFYSFIGKVWEEEGVEEEEVYEIDLGRKGEFQDFLNQIDIKAEYKKRDTKVSYNFDDEILLWKQRSKLFKKRYRFFRLGCASYLY